MSGRQIYALYRGEENLADGTAEEIAKKFNIKAVTVRKMSSPSYQKKASKGNCLFVVKLGKEKWKKQD